jgi:hypothetical protein
MYISKNIIASNIAKNKVANTEPINTSTFFKIIAPIKDINQIIIKEILNCEILCNCIFII